MDTVFFTKVLDVKAPHRGTPLSAGLDFFVPENTEPFLLEFTKLNPYCGYSADGISVRSHNRILIPSGIKVRIPENTMLTAFNKGGVAAKLGLVLGPCVVDADYTGEILLGFVNTTNDSILITYGQKITQLVLVPILYPVLEEVQTEEALYGGFESARGAGKLGSTGSH